MPKPRPIDERDIDKLLAGLTDRQIAHLYNQDERDIAKLRRERQELCADDRPRRSSGDRPKVAKRSRD